MRPVDFFGEPLMRGDVHCMTDEAWTQASYGIPGFSCPSEVRRFRVVFEGYEQVDLNAHDCERPTNVSVLKPNPFSTVFLVELLPVT